LLMVFGILAGPSGFDLLPAEAQQWYEFLAAAGLTMVAFLLGGALSLAKLQRLGKRILIISGTVVAVTIFSVGGGLIAFGVETHLALMLAGIATATDPAATQDVIRQTRAKGPFTDTLLGIVAIDDAWGLIAFSLLLISAKSIAGLDPATETLRGLWELFGAGLVGVAVGFPAAYLTGRIRSGEPMQSEALGVVFLCAGLAIWLKVSFLLAGMVAGAIVVNTARHHRWAFHEIEHIEWPFMILFFILAGASLRTEHLWNVGIIGVGYLVLRTVGRVAGGWIGGRASHAPDIQNRWMGLSLTPQAGVAVGMALVASDQFPELRETILTVTIATTVVAEIAGPLLTQVALRRNGDTES
jgi:Kef-type K+ transport system membrane component KefB